MESQVQYRPSFQIYHPNNRGDGSFLALSVIPDYEKDGKQIKGSLMVTIVAQKPNTKVGESKIYDLDKKVTMKLSIFEIGKLLSVLYCREDEVGQTRYVNGQPEFAAGLPHQTKNFSSKLYFKSQDTRHNLTLSQTPKGGQTTNLSFTFLGPFESIVFTHYLEKALKELLPM